MKQDLVAFCRRSVRRWPATALTLCLSASAVALLLSLAMVADAVLLKQPFEGTESVEVLARLEREGRRNFAIPFDEVDQATAESGLPVAAFSWPVRDGQGPDSASYASVSINFFGVLGIHPQTGRLFQEVDSISPTVAVISDALWRSSYARAPDVVGRQVTIDRRVYTIIGVAPAGFTMPRGTDMWRPIETGAATAKRFTYRLIAKRPASLSRSSLSARLRTFSVTPLRDYLRPTEGREILVLSALNGLLLLVIWIHLVLTQVADSIGRLSEFRVRLALGGARWRVVRTSLTDAYATVLISVVAGAAVSPSVLAVLVRRLPAELLIGRSIGLDSRAAMVLAVVLIVGLAAVTLATLPALSAMRGLSGGGFGRVTTRAAGSVRWVVGLQVLATTAVLHVVGLAGASMVALETTELGYRPTNVLAIESPEASPLRSAENRSSEGDLWISKLQSVIDTVDSLPGVVAVGTSLSRPGLASGGTQSVWLPEDGARRAVSAELNVVAGNYFEALQIPVVAGTVFDARISHARPVRGWDQVVIDTTLAAALGVDLIGRELSIGGFPTRIIGVVGAARLHDPDEAPTPRYYLKVSGGMRVAPVLLVRYDGGADNIRASAARVVQEGLGEIRTPHVVSLSDELDRLRAPYRGRFQIVSFVGSMTALLTVTGVFGVCSYVLARSRRELAVRIAMGASRRQVFWVAIRAPLVAAVCGIAAGVPVGILLGAQLGAALYLTTPLDATVVGSTTLFVAAIAIAGAAIPTRRALASDVSSVLRDD